MTKSDPYRSGPSCSEPHAQHLKPCLSPTLGIWALGTFSIPILVTLDILLPGKIVGWLLYPVLLVSPVGILVAVCMMDCEPSKKLVWFFGTMIFVAVQFVVIGLGLIATSGLDGVH